MIMHTMPQHHMTHPAVGLQSEFLQRQCDEFLLCDGGHHQHAAARARVHKEHLKPRPSIGVETTQPRDHMTPSHDGHMTSLPVKNPLLLIVRSTRVQNVHLLIRVGVVMGGV